MKKTVHPFWKRFAGSATGFVAKYRDDVLFRTQANIILLQILLGLVLLVLVGIGFNLFYANISSTLIGDLMEQVRTAPSLDTAEVIVTRLEEVKMRGLVATTAILILVTSLFGYIIARATLRPARNTLKAQKQFIGNIAHELRTPVSIVKTNIEVAQLDRNIDPKLRELFKSNIEELDRISDLINNLVSLNTFLRPEQIEFDNVDFGKVVDGAVAKLTEFAKSRQLEITVRKSEFRMVRANATALEQIVVNLLKNAILYTPQQGAIHLTIEPDYHNFIQLIVRDTGIGIERDDLFHIFEPFYRAERSRKREDSGSGLGLTIVNDLVRLHHGKITIRSMPRRGTTVVVAIPASTHGSGNAAAAVAHDEIAVDFSQRHPAS